LLIEFEGIAWPRTASLEDITAQVDPLDIPTIVIAGELDHVDSPDLLKVNCFHRSNRSAAEPEK
jgi:pimeloyl-ACP methyl ester carboxylesterase